MIAGGPELSGEDGVAEEFSARFTQSSGIVYWCLPGDVIPTIEKIIADKSRGKNCYSNVVLKFFSELGIDVTKEIGTLRSAFRYDPKGDGLDILSEIDLGITTADYGIAESGSLVEIAHDDSTKLLSSLSRINIILLRKNNIMLKLHELAPVLRRILSSDDKPTVTLIGGPSRTADIEMKMVLGVHGPHEVHVVII